MKNIMSLKPLEQKCLWLEAYKALKLKEMLPNVVAFSVFIKQNGGDGNVTNSLCKFW